MSSRRKTYFPSTDVFVRDTIVDALHNAKYKLQDEIGLDFIHNGQLVAAFTKVEKHKRFLVKTPDIQGAIQFPNNIMVMYDYLDEFRYLNWSSLCSGETRIQLKIAELHNLLSFVIKLGESVCSKCKYCYCVPFTPNGRLTLSQRQLTPTSLKITFL